MRIQVDSEELLRAALQRITSHPVPNLSFLGMALVAVCWGLASLVRGYPTGTAVGASLAGVLLAWWASSRPRYHWVWASLLFTAGLFLCFIQASGLMGTLLASMADAVKTGAAVLLAFLRQVFQPDPTPPAAVTAPASWTRLNTGLDLVWGRFVNWLGLFVKRQPFFDEAAVAVWWSAAAWVLAWWAGILLRYAGPVLAVTPAGVLLIALLNRSVSDPKYLLPFIGAVFALFSSSGYFSARQRWEDRRLDQPETLGADTAVGAGMLMLAVLLAGFTATYLPALHAETLRGMIDSLQPGGEAGGQPVEDAFGIQPANHLATPPTRSGSASLPRQHLIGAGPELSTQPALVLKILSDSGAGPEQAPPETYYLRGLVYDYYLYAGWASSAFSTRQIQPGETIQSLDPDTAQPREIEQLITLAPTRPSMVFTIGDPLAVSQGVEASRRAAPSGQMDLFGLGIAEETYRAWSSQPLASGAQLREAGNNYPDWIRQRYLQLPEGMPGRVINLAASFARLPTPYDTAVAIESYLRTIPYTLDIPKPPVNQDIVDYFLFDLKKGYCDYYASAMVVLARLNGLPARLVIGYVAGTYDPINRVYLVTELSAHSWPEVYFPGYGWIPFEPTASQSVLDRSYSPVLENLVLTTPIPPAWLRSSSPGLLQGTGAFLILILTGLLLSFLGYPLFDRWRIEKDGTAMAITRLYRRYERLALRLAGPRPAGLTPFEINTALNERLAVSTWPRQRASLRVQAAAAELTGLYVLAAYAPQQRTPAEVRRAWQLWTRLQHSSRILTIFRR